MFPTLQIGKPRGMRVVTPPPLENDFFKFSYQLQQSAIYYSNLAYHQYYSNLAYQQQLILGYQNLNLSADMGRGRVEDAKKSKSNPSRRKEKRGSGVKHVPNGIIGGGGGGGFGEGRVIPVINVSAPGVEVQKKVKTRKVNFAQPLHTTKIKSPTPMAYFEEANNESSTDIICTSSDEGLVLDSYSSNAHSREYLFGTGDNVEFTVESNEVGYKRKRKRKKKRRNKDVDITQSGMNENSFVYDPNDPYAMYAIPLNEDDYEFVSEIRLCGGDVVGDGETKEKPAQAINIGEEGVKEMKALYGELGASRILTMEEVIESNFMTMLKNV